MESDSIISNPRARLEELAAQAGVFMSKRTSIQRTPTLPPFTEDDKSAADRLVSQRRHEAFSSKSHLFRRTPSQRNFTRDELYAAVETLIRDNGSPGVLRCLLEQSKDAKVKKNVFHKDGSAKPDINSLLHLATEKGNSSMVFLLGEHADTMGLDSSLKFAVMSDNVDCAAALFRNGANAKTCCEEFIAAVDSGNRPLVSAFLNARFSLDISSLDRALAVAVLRGRIQLVVSLLQHGADGNNVEALDAAVQNGRIDIVAALVLAERPPTTISLDRAVRIANETGQTRDRRLILIELLLAAGAKGDCVGSTLAVAVRRNDERVVSLLVTYGGSVTHNSCEAITTAAADGNLKLLDILFRGRIDPDSASCVLSGLPRNGNKFSASDMFYIISILVKFGAYGQALDKCLLYAAEVYDMALVEFLVSNNASVNYENGKALVHAMSSGSMPLVKALLKGRLAQESLGNCMRSLTGVSSSLQVPIGTALLAAGAKGGEVDAVLIKAVSGDFTVERESFIESLVRHGADVNVDNGVCFQKSVSMGDTVALNLLLKGRPSSTSLSLAVPSAMSLPNNELRFGMLDLLLSSGARGPVVDHQLLELVDKSIPDLSIVKLFFDKGKVDVNVNDGKLLQQACKHKNNGLLEVLLKCGPSVDSVNVAFSAAVALQDPNAQYILCKQLLAAGARGEALDNGMVDVQTSSSSHPQLLELLLKHGANVSYRNGTVIRKAIKRNDVQQLELLISKKPTLQVLATALEFLVKAETSRKCQMTKAILDAGKPGLCETIDKVLAATVELNKETDTTFLELLLEYGARVDYSHGLAIRKAIKQGNFEAVDLLLRQSASLKTLEEAFDSAWTLDKRDRIQYTARVLLAGYRGLRIDDALLEAVQERPRDLPVIRMLLDHDASVHHQRHKPLVHVSTSMDIGLTEMLLKSVSDKSGVSFAFGEVIGSGTNWLSDDGYTIMELLLQNGASGDLVGIALILAVENSNACPRSTDFVDLFLRHGASVDYQDGRALEAAIMMGQLALVKKILDRGPSHSTLAGAFSLTVNSDLAEDTTVQLMEMFKNGPVGMPDLDSLWVSENAKQEEPLTFTCLKKWPRGTKVLEQILHTGIHVDSTIPYVIETEQGLEHVSLLLWALLQPQQRISPYVIDLLLKHGADANFQSSGSLTTPILVASTERTPETVLKLIRHDADVSANDRNGKTPLFHATQRGQLTTINYLVSNGAMVDDGSLHEAARLLDARAVQLLITHGNDPNFPSMLHDGRSPLAELCLNASGDGVSRAKIRQTINALIAGRANIAAESDGKPLILHALDNSTACVDITTELLASGMWKSINSESNFYLKDDFVYSPTTYITKCLSSCPSEHAPELLRILKANGCKDVFYKQSGPQPPDIVGAPPEILDEERRRKARLRRLEEQEEEHQIALKREREAANQQQDIMSRTHRLRLQHDQETADQRDAATERSARLQIRLDGEAATQRQRFADQQHAAELVQQREMNNLRLESDRQRNQLQIEHEQSSASIQKGLLDSKLAAEMKRLQQTEAMYNRQYERESNLAARQEKLMQSRKEVMNSANQQNLLEYNGSQLD